MSVIACWRSGMTLSMRLFGFPRSNRTRRKAVCFSGWVVRSFRLLLERRDSRLLSAEHSIEETALTAFGHWRANLSACLAARSDCSSQHGSNLSELFHQFLELVWEQGLGAIADRFLRVRMNFNQQAVRSGCNRSPGHRRNLVATAGAMRGVDNNGEVGEFLDNWDRRNIQCVAGVVLKGSNATLAQDDFMVSAGENIFGRKEPLFDGCGNPAFEQHRF